MQNTSSITNFRFVLLLAACISLVIFLTACTEEKKITTCDGQGMVEVAKDTTGQALADTLMDQWTRDHPDRDWMTMEKMAINIFSKSLEALVAMSM